MQPCAGLTGSTTTASSPPSGKPRLLKPRPTTLQPTNSSIWSHGPTDRASGEPGTLRSLCLGQWPNAASHTPKRPDSYSRTFSDRVRVIEYSPYWSHHPFVPEGNSTLRVKLASKFIHHGVADILQTLLQPPLYNWFEIFGDVILRSKQGDCFPECEARDNCLRFRWSEKVLPDEPLLLFAAPPPCLCLISGAGAALVVS